MESLYDILSIDRTATQDQIKSAYRVKARKLHPDVNKAPDAQAQFAKIQQAYEILSDEKKRARYDRTGSISDAPQGFDDSGFGGSGFTGQSVDSEDIGDMFNAFFRGRDTGHRAPPQPPRNLNIEAPLSLDLETIAKGGKVKARTPSGEVVEVTVPPAVAAGATLRVREKGDTGPGGRRGDLLLKIRLKPHPTLTRGTPTKPDSASLDLSTRADISIADATLGGEIHVDCLGQSLSLTVPPATPSGQSLRLKGRGLTNAAGNSGDLYVKLRIVPPDPKTLSEDQTELLRGICQKNTPEQPTANDSKST